MNIVHLDTIEGIETPNKSVLDELHTSIQVASSLASRARDIDQTMQRMTVLSAVHTVNALMAASSAKCTLANPPADIDMVSDVTGDLILKCQHPQPHRWKLDGERI